MTLNHIYEALWLSIVSGVGYVRKVFGGGGERGVAEKNNTRGSRGEYVPYISIQIY